MSQEEIVAVDEHARLVAAHLPFRAGLESDMGGTFALQIDLGQRGGPEDPHDMAGIDPEPDAVWWLDVEGGRDTVMSDLGIDADPKTVAAWIAGESRRAGSPAAVSPAAIAASGFGTSAAMATRASSSSSTIATSPSTVAPDRETEVGR